MSITNHPAETEGLIGVSDSLSRWERKNFRDARYVIVEPHGCNQIGPFSNAVRNAIVHDDIALAAFIDLERDGAMPELVEAILELLPGGLAIQVKTTKVIVDANRTPSFAVGRIIQPSADISIFREILDIHRRTLAAIDEILAAVQPDARIFLPHSMYPNDEIADTDTIDISTPVGLAAYSQVQHDSIGNGFPRNICFVTGDNIRTIASDTGTQNRLQQGFTENGFAWAVNNPFSLIDGKHKTVDYMRARPGKCTSIDIPEDLLCEGLAANRTFKLQNRKADPIKVTRMASMIAAAIGGNI